MAAGSCNTSRVKAKCVVSVMLCVDFVLSVMGVQYWACLNYRYTSCDVQLLHKPEHCYYFKGVTELCSCGTMFIATNVNLGSLLF
jgi:hypothetical protein